VLGFEEQVEKNQEKEGNSTKLSNYKWSKSTCKFRKALTWVFLHHHHLAKRLPCISG
jgi:hypothetical protein